MANYKEEVYNGNITRWNRVRSIVLENPRNCMPSASFYEEEITLLPNGEEISKSLSNILYHVSDFSQQIPLVNTDTYEPTENTFTIYDFYTMAASVYLWVARNRDNSVEE